MDFIAIVYSGYSYLETKEENSLIGFRNYYADNVCLNFEEYEAISNHNH